VLIVKTIVIATNLSESNDPLFSQLFNTATSDSMVKEAIVRRPDYINKKNEAGMTPLIFAAKNGNISRINILLNYKANPNIQSSDAISHTDFPIDKGGNTALHYALFYGNNRNVYDIVIALLNFGASVNIRNVLNDLPIHYLREIQTIPDRTKIFKYMIDHGADVNARGFKGNTIVHQAVEKGDFIWLDVLKSDFRSLVKFNIKNDSGQTPTDLAIALYNTDMVKALYGLP
jgi:ankyrin repeat protein